MSCRSENFCVCQDFLLDTPFFFGYDSTGEDAIWKKIVEQGMLYDFYGELLTEHQRKIYEDVVLNDMSLSEIAEEQGISRQGVHDLVRRCDRTLQSYEERLHLIARFQKVKHTVEKIEQISTETQVRELAGQILEEL